MIGETVLVDGIPVDNVLVEPGLARDVTDATVPAGTRVEYTLRFPMTYDGTISGAKVTVRGVELDTLTFGDHWRPGERFGSWSGQWDMNVIVGRTLGDFTALIDIVSLSTALDALGDPVTIETVAWSGNAQARMTDGTESSGTSHVTRSTEHWRFVVPWAAVSALRPKSTLVRMDGAEYDAVSITNIDSKGEYACIEAVRRE